MLIDTLSWEWIFYVNIPVGVVGLILAIWLVPALPVHSHQFDVPGVLLSASGMFFIVFSIQQGETYDWGTITGVLSVPLLIAVGVALMVAFVLWQARNRNELLLPLNLFQDRNFTLANIAITTVGFTVAAMALPLMLFAQTVRELSPTETALLMVPMAVVSGVLAPVVGRLVDRINPKYIVIAGLGLFSISMFWLGSELTPDVALERLLLPSAAMGLGQSGVWAPLASTATRNLPMDKAGAGSGVYNTTRQVGAVLGSAAIAAMMQARITANLPAGTDQGASPYEGGMEQLPSFLHEPFASAMGQSTYLPAAVLLIDLIAVLFLERPQPVLPSSAAQQAVEAEDRPNTPWRDEACLSKTTKSSSQA